MTRGRGSVARSATGHRIRGCSKRSRRPATGTWAGTSTARTGPKSATAEGLEGRVREGIRGVGDGAVVLMHGWPAVTPTVVERLLASARDDGVAYVGIDELGQTPVETVPW